MSSARLVKAAEVLRMDAATLLNFKKADANKDTATESFLASKDGAALARYFEALGPRERRAKVTLAKTLSERRG